MTLFAGERWVSDHVCVKVAAHDAFDKSSSDDVFGAAVGQLNPIIQQVVSHPVDERIDSETARLNTGVSLELRFRGEFTRDNPVVLFLAENLSAETELISTR